jgi:hypothetical protein
VTVPNPTAFLEKLLELEWPGRAACVTPAPLDPVEAAPLDDLRSFDVLDVLVGPLPEDPSFAFFRVIIAPQVRQHDWPGVAAIVLVEARQRFKDFVRAADAPAP